MTDRDRRPTRVGAIAAVVLAGTATLLSGLGSLLALPVGGLGLLALLAGLLRGNRQLLDAGGLLVFCGVLTGAIGSAGVGSTVLATIATITAWDVANRAAGLGETLGREAPTARLELVHVAVGLLIGLTAAAVAVGTFALVGGGWPVAAVILLVLAGAFLLVGLGTRGELDGGVALSRE